MANQTLKTKFGKVFFSVSTDTLPDFLLSEWAGFNSERTEALKGLEIILKLAEENKVTYILNDNSEGAGPWPITEEDAKEWLQKIEKVGVKKMAHVVAKQVFGALSAKMLEQHEGSLEIKYFENKNSAEHWLSSKA